MTEAEKELETKRYETAAAAAMSPQVQQAIQEHHERTAILLTAQLIRLETTKDLVSKNDAVVAVTSGIELKKYKDHVSIFVDGRPVGGDVQDDDPTKIRFRAPEPVPGNKTANVTLHVFNSPVRGQQTLSYQQPSS